MTNLPQLGAEDETVNHRLFSLARQLALNIRDLDKMLINQGRLLSTNYKNVQFENLQEAEFSIFSQWGEDGILQYLIQNIEVEHKTFVEFGVETFREANCRFLMQKDFWKGMVIDGSAGNVAQIRQSSFYWRHDLTAVEAFITRENIAELVGRSPFSGLGILSIDIDGTDYFVLEALGHLNPSIIIVEYNGIFGEVAAVSVPYSASFRRKRAHHSHLYYGASIAAFVHLLSGRGYRLVGGNAAGNNAFFVRDDLLTDKIKPVSITSAYREASFSEARNARGKLTFARGQDRLEAIAHLPLLDVNTGGSLRVADIPWK